MAVACGRKRKSPQTGYVHHYHGNNDQDVHYSIPIIENFLYTLALLRTKTIENINEAKTILDGLLHFQNTQSRDFVFGNFPIYLHEYPICKDRFTGLHIAAIICWILKAFHQILGQELKAKLERSLEIAILHTLASYEEKGAPYILEIKIGAVAVAAGRVLNDKVMAEKGERILDKAKEIKDDLSWYSPECLGEIAASLYLVYPELSQSPWIDFWDHLITTWHRETATYIGPTLKEWQCAEEPQVTSYDLLMGYLSGAYSARVKKDGLIQLEGVLIPSSEDILPDFSQKETFEGVYKGAHWFIYKTARFAYSCIDEGFFEVNPVYAKGFHPLKIVWGDLQRVHTFVCQDGNARSLRFTPEEGSIIMDVVLGDLIEFEDRENSREIAFFVDTQEGVAFDVSGAKSSTFQPGEELHLQFPGLNVQMTFDVTDINARFLGHRMLGNRPAQIDAKGAQRYNAYDWQIFLRTVRRPEDCSIKVRLKIVA